MSRGVCSDPIKELQHRINLSNALKGKPRSLEHRLNISKTRIERGIGKGEKNYNWKGGKIPFTCTICGKQILIKQYEKPSRKTCGSKECMSKLFSLRTGKKNPHYSEKIKRICPICNKEFEVKPSHNDKRNCCSRKCSAIYWSTNYSGEKSPIAKPKIKLSCMQCGKEIYRLQSDLDRCQRNFCSQDCQRLWRSRNLRGKNHHNWKGGLKPQPYCDKFTSEFKERTRAYWGYVCFNCGTPDFIHTVAGKRQHLHVHHIHYDKKMCCNGSPKDVIPLCFSCNMKANSNRDWWEKYYTDLVYAYHPDGKCFLTREEMKEYKKHSKSAHPLYFDRSFF